MDPILVKKFDHMSLGQGVRANLLPWPLQETHTPPGDHMSFEKEVGPKQKFRVEINPTKITN